MRNWEEVKRAIIRDSAMRSCLYWGNRLAELEERGYCKETLEIIRECAREKTTAEAARGVK